MTITRATADTEIKEGQWVHGSPVGEYKLQYGLHSEPRQVTRIAGQRIHYRRIDGTESFMLKSAVLIVCDTEEEAQSIYLLSLQRNKIMTEKIRATTEACESEYAVHLNQLIEVAA